MFGLYIGKHLPWSFFLITLQASRAAVYFPFGKTLKKFHQLSIDYYLLKNNKWKVKLTEVY